MKTRLLILSLLIGLFSLAKSPPEINEIRNEFFLGWQGECGASDLYEQLQHLNLTKDPLMLAYRGAAEMTMANCVFNPWKKYNYFKKGKNALEQAIQKEPKNLEIRYLRFLTQSYLPFFLNYNNLEEDKKFIIESIILQWNDSIPDEHMRFLVEQMIQSEKLSQEEKDRLNLLLSNS